MEETLIMKCFPDNGHSRPRRDALRNEISDWSPSMWASESWERGILKLQPLQPLPIVNLEETLRMQDYRPQLAKVYKIWLNESWLLHLLLHRKALNFLAWDAASCVWSSIILSKIGIFPRGTKEVSTFKNTSTKSRHSMEYPSDKQNGPPPPTRLW